MVEDSILNPSYTQSLRLIHSPFSHCATVVELESRRNMHAAAQTTAAVTDLSDLALASGLSAEEIVAECDPDGELLLELFASWGVCVAGKVALCTLPFLLPLRC